MLVRGSELRVLYGEELKRRVICIIIVFPPAHLYKLSPVCLTFRKTGDVKLRFECCNLYISLNKKKEKKLEIQINESNSRLVDGMYSDVHLACSTYD